MIATGLPTGPSGEVHGGLRIAMVSEHASPLAVLGGVDAGGQNVHVAELACALADRGHEVVVYTRRDDPALPARVPMRDGVVVEHLDAGPAREIAKDDLLPYVPQLAAALAQRLDHDRPNVVHAHFWMSGIATLDAAARCGLPVVQTFHALGTVKRRHQGEQDPSSPDRLDHERRIVAEAERLIASCADEARELAALGALAERIDIVPSGVDLGWFTPRGPVADRSAPHRLLTVGRLVPRKGVDDAIRTVAQLGDDVELIVAGGPQSSDLSADVEVQRLSRLAGDLGVAARVRFVGRVGRADVPSLMRSCDAVLCLPWYEPFGIVPLEAMACGVPVIGSAVGGLLDTIADGVTGLLVPARDPQAAAAAAATLLRTRGLRHRLGRAGRVRACGYGWAEIARRTEYSYRRACAVEVAPAVHRPGGTGPTNGAPAAAGGYDSGADDQDAVAGMGADIAARIGADIGADIAADIAQGVVG